MDPWEMTKNDSQQSHPVGIVSARIPYVWAVGIKIEKNTHDLPRCSQWTLSIKQTTGCWSNAYWCGHATTVVTTESRSNGTLQVPLTASASRLHFILHTALAFCPLAAYTWPNTQLPTDLSQVLPSCLVPTKSLSCSCCKVPVRWENEGEQSCGCHGKNRPLVCQNRKKPIEKCLPNQSQC